MNVECITPIFDEQLNKLIRSNSEVIKLLCTTQLSIQFIMLIFVKMPTIVGILTFISMIDTTSESLKARNVFIFQHFNLLSS